MSSIEGRYQSQNSAMPQPKTGEAIAEILAELLALKAENHHLVAQSHSLKITNQQLRIEYDKLKLENERLQSYIDNTF
ncbi:MAG TPA: hypothetical protein V6C95_13285 [Coleofasciculaceae cyanobacterium]